MSDLLGGSTALGCGGFFLLLFPVLIGMELDGWWISLDRILESGVWGFGIFYKNRLLSLDGYRLS